MTDVKSFLTLGPARDKHPSLFRTLVSYERKKFNKIWHQDCEKGWGVEHQRRHGVEDVGVRHDEELAPDPPAHEHEEREADVAGVDE